MQVDVVRQFKPADEQIVVVQCQSHRTAFCVEYQSSCGEWCWLSENLQRDFFCCLVHFPVCYSRVAKSYI